MFTGVVEPRFSGNDSASQTLFERSLYSTTMFLTDVDSRRLHQNGPKGAEGVG